MLREFVQAQEGKAIPYTMELTDLGGPQLGSGVGYYGATNPYVASGSVPYGRVTTPVSQREAFVHSQTYGGSEPVDWLMDAVGFVITSASTTDIHFENDQGEEFVLKRKATDPDTVKEVPYMLANLFKMPNPYQDWTEFLELTLIDFLLVGNAYWIKFKPNGDGQPAALYRVAPQHIRIVPDQYGPAKYLYKVPYTAQEIELTPDQVLHFKRSNPHDQYYGVGIVKGGARPIDMELALTNTSARYYENQTLPTGVVQTDRRVPREVFNKLKAQLQSFYGGSQNSGRLMVLEAGLKFTSVSPTAADALFAQMGAWSRDRILAMFNMNAALLGMGDAADGGQVAGWQRLFDQKTMIPLLTRFGKAVSRGLTQLWGLDLCFDYEETQAPEDVINRANLLAKLPGVKVHELRDAAGLAPSTGDENVDHLVLNLPGPNLDSSGQGGFPDRNLPGEAGRPPLPENTVPIASVPPNGPAGGNRAVVARNTKAVLDDVQRTVDAISARAHTVEGKALAPARAHIGDIDSSQPPEDLLHADRTAGVDGIVADMHRELQNAAHELERGLLDAAEGKAEGTLYQRVKNSKAWAKFRARVTDILRGGAERGVSLANLQHAKAGHQPTEADYTKIAKQQIARTDGGATSVVKNLKDALLSDVLSLQRHGSNPGEYAKSIMEHIDGWRSNSSELAALTEATLAYNEGTALVAEANGLNLLVSDGTDSDEPCQQANGQVWTPEQARSNSLEHPRCRRAFVPIDREATASP